MSSISKNEKHGVDDIRLSTSIRTDDGSERLNELSVEESTELTATYLVEWTKSLFPSVRLEVDVCDVGDDESLSSFLAREIRRWWRWRNVNITNHCIGSWLGLN